MVACLAVNLETISIRFERSSETRLGRALNFSYPKRFTKLRHIGIWENSRIISPVIAGLETLTVCNTKDLQLYHVHPSVRRLCTLELEDI